MRCPIRSAGSIQARGGGPGRFVPAPTRCGGDIPELVPGPVATDSLQRCRQRCSLEVCGRVETASRLVFRNFIGSSGRLCARAFARAQVSGACERAETRDKQEGNPQCQQCDHGDVRELVRVHFRLSCGGRACRLAIAVGSGRSDRDCGHPRRPPRPCRRSFRRLPRQKRRSRREPDRPSALVPGRRLPRTSGRIGHLGASS